MTRPYDSNKRRFIITARWMCSSSAVSNVTRLILSNAWTIDMESKPVFYMLSDSLNEMISITH